MSSRNRERIERAARVYGHEISSLDYHIDQTLWVLVLKNRKIIKTKSVEDMIWHLKNP